jgi:hypothetical protein
MEQAMLDKTIKENLASAGLLEAVNSEKSQLLEFPEEFFLELVLNDGSKLDETGKLIERVRSLLDSQGVRLAPVVRALWKVRGVSKIYPGLVFDETHRGGGLVSPFQATLESGSAHTNVRVDVTPGGYEELKRAGQVDDESLERIVRDFLTIQLSVGGTSYWDPIRYPRQELNGAAVLYTLHHMPVAAG